MTTRRHSEDQNKDDGFVPLSFLKDKEIALVTSADAQALNSLAAAQQYSSISAFYDIHRNDRKCLTKDFIVEYGNEAARTHKYDANGATILHQCFQHGKYDMVKWLIENFPSFSLLPFLHKRKVGEREIILPYGGQNILHMAVLAKNHYMAQWILNYFSRSSDEMLYLLLTERVYTQEGSFFSKLGAHYFGETPLQFAVSMDDVEMFDMIMSFVSLLEPIMLKKGKLTRNMLFYPDCNGNNVVHLCVRRSLHKMCEHIKYFAVEMLQQELMIAVHNSFIDGFDVREAPENGTGGMAKCVRGVKYVDFFDSDESFKFTGHTRVLGDIALPDWEVLKDFFVAQVVGHLITQVKDANVRPSEAEIRSKTASLVLNLEKKNFFVNEDAIWRLLSAHLSGPSPSAYDILISELKRKFRCWLYGTEVGIKSGMINKMFNRLFIYGLNQEKHSPVTLAAGTGQPLMLRYLLKQNVSKGDRNYEFDLTGIEFRLESTEKHKHLWLKCYEPHLPDGVYLQSSIAWISRSSDPKINSIIDSIPELSFVVDYKWERVGVKLSSDSRMFELLLVVLLVLLNVLIGITYHVPRGAAGHSCEIQKFEIDQVGSPIVTADPPAISNLWIGTLWVLFINCNGLLGFIVVRFHLGWMGRVCEVAKAYMKGWGSESAKSKSKQFPVSITAPTTTGLESFEKTLHMCSTAPSMLYKLCVDANISQNPAEYDILFRVLTILSFVLSWVSVAWSSLVQGNFSKVPCWFIKCATLFSILDAFLHIALLKKEFGCFMLTLFQIFMKDFVYFGYFFIGTVITFALVLSDEGSNTFGTIMNALIRVAVQDESFDYRLSSGLSVLFHLAINIVMINLLIAVMGNTYSWFNGDIDHAKAKLKCVRYLWMDTFIQLSDSSDVHYEQYCHKRPAFGAGEDSDSYFFRVMERIEEVDKRANAVLHKDATEKKPATIDANENLITHTEKTEEEVSTSRQQDTLCGGGKYIFHSNFWIDEYGNHPPPDTSISFSDVNNFIWKPVNRHQIDYCRYATRELEKKNMRLQISHYKRKVLLILHPQNDFSDRVPRMYPIESLVIEKPGTLISASDKTSRPGIEFKNELLQFPLMINGCKVWFIGAEERKGTVKGVRVKGTATAAANRDGDGLKLFVEVLWDADRYKPRALCVEGFHPCDSDMRHFRRLQNALEQKLRVYLVDDPRPPESRRYGRLTRVESTEISVRWDLSVPCCVRKANLVCTFTPENRQAFDPGCIVCFKETVPQEGSPQINIAPPADILTPGLGRRQRNSGNKPAGYVHGSGQVVKHTEKNLDAEFVEVFWDGENSCGNLPIQGSFADFTHTANLIRKNWAEYDEIIVSRDCHRCNHISHKSYWKKGGDEEDPNVRDLQVINYLDVLTGVVRPVQEAFTGHCLNYIWELVNQGHYQHLIWPTHCLVGDELAMAAEKEAMARKYRHCADSHYRHIGHDSLDLHVYNSTRGHEIVPEIRDALIYWKSHWKKDRKVRKEIQVVDIGYNIAVEAYSIFKSEVENFSDPLSGLNHKLLANLNNGDTEIHVCGEALSHVVRFSFEDLLKHTTQPASNITLLINCTSIVSSFYQKTAAFVNEMKAKGVQIQEVDKDGKLRRLDKSRTIEESIARHPAHRKEQNDSRQINPDDVLAASDVAILHASTTSTSASASSNSSSACSANANLNFSLKAPEDCCDWFQSLMEHLNAHAVANSYRDVVVKECTNYHNVDLKTMLGSRVAVLGVPKSLLNAFGSCSQEELMGLVDGNGSEVRNVIAGWICLLVCKVSSPRRRSQSPVNTSLGSPVRRVTCYDIGNESRRDEDEEIVSSARSTTPRTSGGSQNHRRRGESADRHQLQCGHQIRNHHDHNPHPRDRSQSNVHRRGRGDSVDISLSTSAVLEADHLHVHHLQQQNQQQQRLPPLEEEDVTHVSAADISGVDLEEDAKRNSNNCDPDLKPTARFLPSVSTVLVSVLNDMHHSLSVEGNELSPSSSADFLSPTDSSSNAEDYQDPTGLVQSICSHYGFTLQSFQRMRFKPTCAVWHAITILQEHLNVEMNKDSGTTWKYLSSLTLDRIVVDLLTDTVQACSQRQGSSIADIPNFVIDALGHCVGAHERLVLDEDHVKLNSDCHICNNNSSRNLRDLNTEDLISLFVCTNDASLQKFIPEIAMREMTGQMLIDGFHQARDRQGHILDDTEGVLGEYIENWMKQKMFVTNEVQ